LPQILATTVPSDLPLPGKETSIRSNLIGALREAAIKAACEICGRYVSGKSIYLSAGRSI
jgi:hypothetical protein